MSSEAKHELDEILIANKLELIDAINSGDIFVVGYPKSGNTWVQYLIAGVVFGVDTRFSPDSLIQDLVPDVNFKQFYKRYLSRMFFKTHDLPKPNYRKVIYLIRDGRDVMVSYFHHLTAIGGSRDFLKLVSTGEGLFPCRWHEHVDSWIANPYGAQMLTISYESLKEDAVTQLQKICEFTSLERERSFLARVARNSNFESMRNNEEKFGWSNPIWPRDKRFVRRGEVGSFKDEMSAAVLESFMSLSARTLGQFKYLP